MASEFRVDPRDQADGSLQGEAGLSGLGGSPELPRPETHSFRTAGLGAVCVAPPSASPFFPLARVGPTRRGRCDRCAQRLPGAISKIGEGSEHLVDREKPHCASPAITRCPDADHGNDHLDDTRVYLRRGLLTTPGPHGHTVPDTTSWQTFLRINVTSSSVWVSFSISALVMTMRRIFLIRATEMR